MEAPPPPPPQEAPPPPAPEPPTGRQSDDSDVEMDGVEYDPNEEQADDDEEFVPETTGMATRGEATKAPVAPVIRRVPSHVEPEIAEARRTQKERLAKLKEGSFSLPAGSGDATEVDSASKPKSSEQPMELDDGAGAAGGPAGNTAAKELACDAPQGCWNCRIDRPKRQAGIRRFDGDSSRTAATQQLLNRGSLLTELLKQKQFTPLPFEDQVVTIFSGTAGYLDSLEVSDVGPFQVGLIAYVKSNHPKVLEDIAAQGELSPELDGQIKDIMTKYTAEYSA